MNTRLIREKIVSGQIKTWPDVYRYTTAKELSERLGRGVMYWEGVRYDPMKMTLETVFRFIEEVQISRNQFYRLVGDWD